MASPIGPLDLIRAAQWLPLEAPEKAVLIAMITNERVNHTTWTGNPAVAALAMASGYKRRRVQEALTTLGNARMITRIDRLGGGAAASEWRLEAFRIMAVARVVRPSETCGAHGIEGCTTCTGAPHAPAPVEQGEIHISIKDNPAPTGAGAPHARVQDVHGRTECTPGYNADAGDSPQWDVSVRTDREHAQPAADNSAAADAPAVCPLPRRPNFGAPPQAPAPNIEPPPAGSFDHYAEPATLGEVWCEELASMPPELRGKPPGLLATWDADLLAAGPVDAEEAIRALAALCRGTPNRAPRVFEWSDLCGQRARYGSAWREALAWRRLGASEPLLGRQHRKASEAVPLVGEGAPVPVGLTDRGWT